MKAAITGATGFIGSRLIKRLEVLNYSITAIGRKELSLPETSFNELIEGHDLVINLAGAPIIARHTPAYKKEIYSSRIDTTRKLVNAIKIANQPPAQFISQSAIGIYSGKMVNTETSFEYGNDFMAQVCNDWEQVAKEAEPYTRLAIIRTSIVLDAKGGALPTMMLPFKFGVGGKIGTGNQMFSWIHIDDYLDALIFIIEGKKTGIYNLASPGYLRNSEFTRALADKLHRPALFTVPEFALKLIYGDGAKALTSGQAVYPQKLIDEGFQFKFPTIEQTLSGLVVSD